MDGVREMLGAETERSKYDMTEPERLLEAAFALLTEEDFEQMRVDTRKLVVENEQLRQRIAQLECHIVTHGWAERKLH
jgi:hypothetical protein